MEKKGNKEEILIDGKNAVLGRLAAFAAKKALEGKKVIIFNCNETIILGNKSDILKRYNIKVAKGHAAQEGPYFQRIPNLIVRRTIRGMLPRKKNRGRAALKNVICYCDMPKEFESREKVTHEKKDIIKFITLRKLCDLI